MSENSNFKKRIQSFLGGKQSKLYDSFLTNLEAFPEAYSNSKDTGELIERNKELLCIHTVSQITNSREHPFDTVLELVAKIIAQAFQFPDIAEAQIICCDDVYQTSNFKKTNDLLSAEIPLSYFSAGELNVVYTQKPETDSQTLFLPQEEALIHTLARIIGNAVENRRYEKALIESESKYRRFFQQSGVGILRFSQTGEILETNKAFAQILGFEDAEALVEHSVSVLPFHKNPDDFNKLRETLEARGSFENYTISALTAKGTDIWLEMNAVKLQDKDLYYYEAVVKDITKEVKAKQQLAESEKRYRALLSAANDAIFVADIESGRIIQCNKQAERLLKKTQDEITAMHFSDLHPEDKREEYAEGFRKQAEKAKSVLGLFWVVDSNQNHIPVEISSAVTTSGDKTLSIGIFRDMSERQNNEMQLKAANEEFAVVNERLTEANEELIQSNELLNESEQKFRAIFDNINDAVGLHKIDHGRIGKFIEVNRRACEMFGYDLSEFQKMNPEDMIPEDNREQVATLFQQLLSKGYARAETYNRTKSGKLIPVEINALIFEMGGENFLTAVTRDISRQVQDREIIRKSEERYKLLSSLTFEGIILHDKGILHDANQSFYDIFGYSEDELLGKNIISLLIDKESQELIYENIRKKVAKPYEVTGLKKDGTAIPLELEAYNLQNTPGNFRVAAVRNIAERKQAEKTIRETNKQLKELNATKDKFFSIISHDLKNPFGQLVGFSELIMKSLEKGNYDKIYDFSRVIYDSSHHGMKLLETLLQWSRAQTGRIRFKPVELNLKQVVEATMDSVRSAALKKNIELQNLITEQTVLEADEDMLQTILRNLISNALKYSRPGDDIQIYSIENEGYILISVNDNGIGMKPETADNLFNIAQNVSVKGTANETGTGLGLILCKEFAEKHGGSISVESAYGKGSTFTLELPYRPLSE